MLRKAIALTSVLTLLIVSTVYSQSFIKNIGSASSFIKLGANTLFFGDNGNGGIGIWKTDGTPGNTVLVKAVNVLIDPNTPVAAAAVFKNKVYFQATDGINGAELWQTDGTANGTFMVKDINTAHVGNTGSQPNNFTVFNGALYFIASDASYNYGLWKTDGTSGGTVKVYDSGYNSGGQMVVVGNTLYFNFGKGSLWHTDGTTAGTSKIVVDDYYTVEGIQNINNELVFFTSYTYEHTKIRLYKLKPVDNVPVLLHDYSGIDEIDNITAVGTKFFFSIRTAADNNNDKDALWISDGTAAGTTTVKTFAWQRYLSNSNTLNFSAYKNKLYFAGSNDHTLWTSDGTDAGTVKISPIVLSTTEKPIVFNQKLYFNGNNLLCSFDGSNAITELQSPLGPASLFDGGNKLYFVVKTNGGVTSVWNNDAAAQLLITINYQRVNSGGLNNFTSKVDSTVTVPVTVKNIGNKDLEFNEISVAGSSFYVNGTPSKTLLSGQTANFNLLYSPAREEQVSAALVIKSNDNSGQTNFASNLTGTATGTAVKKNNVPAAGLFKAIAFKDTLPGFTLSQNTIAENAAINTTVGSFKIAGDTAKYQFQLTPGTGDADNTGFKIESGLLKTITAFNFNNKSTYTIHVKAVSSTTSVEKMFTIQVTNIQNLSSDNSCAASFKDIVYSLNDAVYAGSRIVAVGTGGKILASEDDGKNWHFVNSGLAADFSRVRFTDNKTGYILGGNSVLMKTENGGDSWFPLTSPGNSYPSLNNFYFPSAVVGYVFGGDGVYKTKDGGRSWQKNYTSYDVLNSGWFADENNGFICGTGQTLIHTTDGGKTWEQIALPSVGVGTALSAITFINSKTGYIISTAGDVLQTTDGGKTWPRISTVSTDGFTSNIYFLNENTGYLLAGFNSANVFKTTDGGKTWNAESNITSGGAFLGMAINKTGDKLCVVGHGIGLGYTSAQGSVIFLKNGATDWQVRSVIRNDNYYGGNLFASGTGYVIGAQSFKTTDGGITWKDLNIVHDYNYPFLRGYFIDDNTGFYTDIYSIYKTTDGAATWVKKNTDSTLTIRNLYFFNRQLGFYFNDQNLYRSVDGGDTWTNVLKTDLSPNVGIGFYDQQTGFMAGFGSIIYKTTDGGTTWSKKDLGNGIIVTSIGFFDSKTVMAGGLDGSLYRSTDGGETWNPIYTGMIQVTTTFQFISATHGYLLNKGFGGSVSEVYESTDAGLTWQRIYQSWNPIWGFSYNDGHLFLAGESGSMTQFNSLNQQPVNAGYITGDTTIAVANKLIYSVPAINNTQYKWAVTGAANVEYQNNQVIVAWKKGGQYTLQVTPYNNCGSGESRIMNIDVEDMPDPVITGPDTVLNHATNVVYTATIHDVNTYNFNATNASAVVPQDNKATVNWGSAGAGIITVVESNPKLNLKKSASKNVVIKQDGSTLPENNFTVLINSVTCKGSNNGAITIKALQPLSYVAIVTGPGGFNKNYAFTDSLGIRNLVPGVYNVCLSVVGNTSYQRCYDANITEPKDIALYTAINPTTHVLTLNLSGADNFNIELNNKQYQTNSTQINLPLSTGANRLKVYTDRPCQGVIEKIINLSKITIYPNPFADKVNIDLGGSTETNINVEISNVFGARLYSGQQTNDGGPISINTANLGKGVYVLKLTLGQTNTVFKIIKQ